MEVTAADYAWAAGIIEGEGSIVNNKIKDRANSFRSSISVTMSDEDVIRKLHSVLEVGTVCGPYNKEGRKPIWSWAVQNQKGCFDTLLRIMPYLGKRRLEKASELFEQLEPKVVV